VVYDEQLERYVMVGVASNHALPETEWGVYYSLSEDLIEWTQRELLLELPVNATVGDPDNDTTHAYPAIIDPDSSSLNYSTTDGEMYLYVSRFNFGGASLDRDVLRWPIAVEEYVVEPPDWTFDTAGDTEDWQAEFDLTPLDVADGELRMQSTGDDPYLVNGNMLVPADYHQLVIRMRVPDGVAETGQLFWVTSDDPEWGESKSVAFLVAGNGEYQDYEFDMSANPAWSGTIRALRIDPLESADRDVAIDRIWFPTA
jgi:hypothetical protein